MGFTKLDDRIFGSSIMDEDPMTRLVWLLMLASADKGGVVDETASALARKFNLPGPAVLDAIAVLTAEDPESRTSAEGGRRLMPIDDHKSWGWKIVNHALYRNTRDPEERRAYQAKWLADKRAKEKEDAENVDSHGRQLVDVDSVDKCRPKQKQSAEADCRGRKQIQKGSATRPADGSEAPRSVEVIEHNIDRIDQQLSTETDDFAIERLDARRVELVKDLDRDKPAPRSADEIRSELDRIQEDAMGDLEVRRATLFEELAKLDPEEARALLPESAPEVKPKSKPKGKKGRTIPPVEIPQVLRDLVGIDRKAFSKRVRTCDKTKKPEAWQAEIHGLTELLEIVPGRIVRDFYAGLFESGWLGCSVLLREQVVSGRHGKTNDLAWTAQEQLEAWRSRGTEPEAPTWDPAVLGELRIALGRPDHFSMASFTGDYDTPDPMLEFMRVARRKHVEEYPDDDISEAEEKARMSGLIWIAGTLGVDNQ